LKKTNVLYHYTVLFLDEVDADFVIPEDAEMGIWQNLISDDDEIEVPFVKVPNNLFELYPQGQGDDDNICVVCRIVPRTRALVPCGHRVLCIDCLSQLQTQKCPICNNEYSIAICIW